jgi:AcrR family transcriptional regulator
VRSEATRTELLVAAKKIFARDGFERAQIDTIAREAGRTRGAVYAQFRTKEQLFFALLEEHLNHISRELQAVNDRVHRESSAARLRAVKNFFADTMDPTASILELEFKFYALRHPESKETLGALYERVFNTAKFMEDYDLHEEPGRATVMSRLQSLNAINGAVLLAMHFHPEVITSRETKLLLEDVFEAFFPSAT